MKLRKYITNEYQLMLGTLLPYSVLLNYLIFAKDYFTDTALLVSATLITLAIKVLAWQLHTYIAMVLFSKFPKDGETMTRIGISLLFFLPLTASVITFICWFYHFTGIGGFEFHTRSYAWALASGVGLNLLATFLHEGVANFEKWKAALTETEQLKTEYAKSRLEGLKTQVNPHFLFNSINTLSSLISADPEKAEIFLDEMCKVYRYLLKSDKGEFVELRNELQFVRSWFYILKIRYGSGIFFDIDVTDQSLEKRIPPLTLQLLVEHIISRNMMSKLKPLHIRISASDAGPLELRHTISLKINAGEHESDASMTNVINKFRLLETDPVRITRHAEFQVIEIPLT